MLVAVYGTLKKGESNYDRLLSGREPVFRGAVRLPYLMYENGEYPMIVPADEDHPIGIEVFDVDDETLRSLDALEEPYHYRRETIALEELEAEVEIYVHAAPAPPGFTLVASGVWMG